MCINARKYLGNTPTPIAGPNTLMRFGIIGMGMGTDSHTFHIHGHRWIMPGPHGTDPLSIRSSIMDTPVSDLRILIFLGLLIHLFSQFRKVALLLWELQTL